MGDAATRTTRFLAELVGDLETVNGICSKCPEGISLEENFAGWEPSPKPLVHVFLVAHQGMAADTAALQLALVLENILNRPQGTDSLMQMWVTVSSDVKLSRIQDHFRLVADCAWAKFQFTSAPSSVISVQTTNMSALLKGAAASR
ncbi:hypothetical protein [Achromobacter sp. Root565]|uniref:hypothetical protein n=1 Tax=Achromobacter sp. Root565 TaxID=1736564 RepID=UPI0012E34E23|nr:hypothetical protein [Achromobacter sp. Root565]